MNKKLFSELLEKYKGKVLDDKIRNELVSCVISKEGKKGNKNNNTFVKNDDNVVIGLLCYYYKKWFFIEGKDKMEWNIKEGRSSGYNEMSKEGSSKWYSNYNKRNKSKVVIEDRLLLDNDKVKFDFEMKELMEVDLFEGNDYKGKVISFESSSDLLEYYNKEKK